MPDPSKYDNEDEWMSACVPAAIDEGREQDQAVAMCMQMWRDRDKAVAPSEARAWSVLTVKSIDSERREIEGLASTPSVDRIGDIVEPMGAKFTLPMPLLAHHRHDQPVGQVTAAKTRKDGITIKAQFAKVLEPGPLKDRIDTAWQEVKSGLVRGLSIGFKPISYEPLDAKDPFGGLRFNAWNWYELSLVTIAANQDASISVIKSADQAALGHATVRPGATGKSVRNLVKLKERMMTTETVIERIDALEAKRAANLARMHSMMEESGKKGETLDDSAADEYDGLEREIETIDKQLNRERKLEKFNVAKAQPVSQVKTVDDGAAVRGYGTIRVKGPDLPKGVRFARVVKCLGLAQGNRSGAAQIAEQIYSDDQGVVDTLKAAARGGELSDTVVKAAVSAATTSETTWAAPLVRETSVMADFIEYLRPMTVIGKFGTDGIPALRRVPFRTALLSETSGGAGYWVGEGRPKPLTKFDYAKVSLTPTKVANISVVTEELLRDSSPSAETLIRDSLAAALVAKLDTDFLGSSAGEAGISPAGLLNGVSAVASSGITQAAVLADIQAVMAPFIAANNIPSQGVWIMASTTAMALGLMLTSLGQPAFPGVTMAGGTLYGMPVIVSDYTPGGGGSPASKMVILVSASDVYIADEGGITVDMSREASLEMSDAPTNAVSLAGGSPAGQPVHTTMVSLWQTNTVGFRAERTVTWQKRRTTAVQALSNVVWGT